MSILDAPTWVLLILYVGAGFPIALFVLNSFIVLTSVVIHWATGYSFVDHMKQRNN